MTPAITDKLEELARRCEEATGPDRNLDVAIYKTVPDLLPQLPDYTASIDTAITLVPEGWQFGFHSDDAAYVYQRPEQGGGYKRIHDCTVRDGQVALALCAAALRARITQ